MPLPHRLSVTIIGGGASGVLLAAHLLANPDVDLRVTLVEKTDRIGEGLAYSARQRDHRVNVPARGMSAFAARPTHFLDWLRARSHDAGTDGWFFAQRADYGRYLGAVLAEAAAQRPGRLTIVGQQVTGVVESKAGVDVSLANGSSLISDFAVLAVGHETQPARSKGIAVRLGSEADTPLDEQARVMVLGSGLSMVDTWLSLAETQHKGPVLVLSRNGLLPKGHRDVAPISIDAADVPFGTNLPYLMRWFRALVAETEERGGDWRSVVDGLRPYNQRLWQSWTLHTRRQFLRHLRPWWNIHRHRLPPDLHQRLVRAIGSGQVQLLAGEFKDISRRDGEVIAAVRPRGTADRQSIAVDRVYDCGGLSVDVLGSSNPVVRQLLERGSARPDPLNIGIDVTDDCALVGDDGSASERVFVVGPLTRGQFFEIEAVPDIRRQAEALATALLTRGKQ